MATKKFNLKGVLKEIAKLERDLKAHRERVVPSGRAILDLKLSQVESIRVLAFAACSKSWGAWPEVRKATKRKK